MDNLTRCYEGIQRVYRNAVLQRIRDTLSAAFGDKVIETVKNSFQREWEGIVAAAKVRRETGEVAGDLRDELDVLGVNHFYNLVDVHFALLCPLHATKPKEDAKQAKGTAEQPSQRGG